MGFTNRCIPILNAKVQNILLVTSVKTKSYQKNRMLRSRESYELEQVLFPRNRLLQPIVRAISILHRAVLPQFLGISRNCNCRCKDCAHSKILPHFACYIILHVILRIRLITLVFAIYVKLEDFLFFFSFSLLKISLVLYIVDISQEWST